MHLFALWAKKAAGLVLVMGSVVLGAAAPAEAAPSAQSSVIGGHVASPAEVPWLAVIAGRSDSLAFSCTGTVIAPRVVLTAGHCVRDPWFGAGIPGEDFAVATGVTDLRDVKRRDLSSVKRAVFYPNFGTAKAQTDAALLILTAPVTVPALPLATPAEPELLAAGTPITISGWGLTDPDNEEIPSFAHTGTLELQARGFCRRHAGHGVTVPYSPKRQLCAIDKPSHQTVECYGDSGGPAVVRRTDGSAVQVGILSGGGAGCTRGRPNVYTRVDAISSWVLGWIAAVEAGAEPPPTPQARPPLLTEEHALELDAVILAKVFRRHFLKGHEAFGACQRLAWEAMKCWVTWRQGGNHYYGRINLQYTVENARIVSTGRVTIHWVDERCTRKHDGADGCVVRTRSRTVRLRGA